MTTFYLIRHGDTDYSQRNTKVYQGFGVNLSPLSDKGIKQIVCASKDSRLINAEIILSSPYTRALQSAAIISKELNKGIIVETDLYEWVANKSFEYVDDEKAEESYKEFHQYSGIYPDDSNKDWEDADSIKYRVLGILDKYRKYEEVIVVCHGMIIKSLCNSYHPKNGEIIEFKL